MKKNKKGVRAYSLGGILLIVLIIALFACGALSVSLPKCAENVGGTVSSVRTAQTDMSNEDYASTDTETFKYLKVPLKGLIGYGNELTLLHPILISPVMNVINYLNSDKRTFLLNAGANALSRKEVDMTVILRLNNVLSAKGNPLLVTKVIKMEIPSYVWNGWEFVFKEDMTVNIRSTYYDIMLKQQDKLNDITISLYANGYGLALDTQMKLFEGSGVFNIGGVSLFSTVTDIDPDDPGDNGGEDGTGQNDKSFLRWLYEWCVSKWGWTISYALFKVLFCGAVVLAGLLILSGIFGGQKIKVIKG